jgi:hypothetical protein
MSERAPAEPCADCLGLAERVAEWAAHYPGYDPAMWDRVLGPHPHLTPGAAVRCRECGCCWSVNENPWCGYVFLDRLTEREYRRRLRGPSRWSQLWREGWDAVILVYAPMLLASVGLAAVLAWHAAGVGGAPDGVWPGVLVLSVVAVASGWRLVQAARGR